MVGLGQSVYYLLLTKNKKNFVLFLPVYKIRQEVITILESVKTGFELTPLLQSSEYLLSEKSRYATATNKKLLYIVHLITEWD